MTHTTYNGKKHFVGFKPCFSYSEETQKIKFYVEIGEDNKEFNDCAIGFSELPLNPEI